MSLDPQTCLREAKHAERITRFECQEARTDEAEERAVTRHIAAAQYLGAAHEAVKAAHDLERFREKWVKVE